MGQFFAIGLRLNVAIMKKDIETQLEDISEDEVLGMVEEKYRLADIYQREEKNEYYIYRLKRELLDKEYLPFLERFYSLRYPKGSEIDEEEALEDVKALPDTTARLHLLENKSYQTYQSGNEINHFYPDGYWPHKICIYSHNAVLSIDGKICMECYDYVFDFIRRCIAAQMSEFALSKALTVWIEG